MERHRLILGVAGIFLMAVLFRARLTILVPQPFMYDQTEYEAYAHKMYDAPFLLAAHTYRSYPYPLILAFIYKYVGFGSHAAVFAVQAILDSLTGLMLFGILWIVEKRRAAWITYILYSVNPFTSAYAGVILSEILTTFFFAAMLLMGLFLIKKPTLLKGLIFGLCVGGTVQTRNAMLTGSLTVLASIWFWMSWKFYKRVYVAIVVGGILTVLYPLYTNWHAYRQISIFKVDSFYAMELYNGATLTILPPFMTSTAFPIGQQQMYREYWSEYDPTRTPADRRAMAEKYLAKATDVIQANPVEYARWRFFKMWYVWQKENIFTYVEPGYDTHKAWTYWVNTILLGFAAMGVVVGFGRRPVGMLRWLRWVSLGIIIFQTIAFSFSHAEYRLTIPLYPVVILLAGLSFATMSLWRSKSISGGE